MDHIYLNTLGFTIQKGTLCRSPKAPNDYSWEIEIYCDNSPQLNYWDWPDDRLEGPDD